MGAWESRDLNSIYGPVATDGFVVATLIGTGTMSRQKIEGYTGESSPPNAKRSTASVVCLTPLMGNFTDSFTMPVRKNDYYRVTRTIEESVSGSATVTIYWIPLGN
ncbi:MAG: hypothetical protein JW714_03635 [Candidatus Omnitrophica bacterium]|nr:hypothetical protein [Candidatus Omnitrophota bacterium]